ncbi:hypothetical protein ACFX13_002605 [Malus domestica]
MAEQDQEIVPVRRPMKDSFNPQDLDQPSCIACQPNIDGTCMLSPQLLNMVPHFNGESLKEDPYARIQEFFDICKTQHIRGLSADEIKLLLFPFSLKEDAKKWLCSLPTNSITAWGQLAKKLIKKMSDEEAIEMCEELAENSQQFYTRGCQAKRGAYAINANDGMKAEMAAMNKNIAALIKTLSTQSSQQALKSDKLEIQVGQLASAVNE